MKAKYEEEREEFFDIGQGVHYFLDNFEMIELEQNRDDERKNGS